jgi:hypothetical protein
MDTKNTEQKKERVQVNVELSGELAELFTRYQEREALKSKATAAYKLIVERLRQVESSEIAA